MDGLHCCVYKSLGLYVIAKTENANQPTILQTTVQVDRCRRRVIICSSMSLSYKSKHNIFYEVGGLSFKL